MSGLAFRRFGEELVTLVGRRVLIETSEGRTHEGNLLGIDEKLDVILDQVRGSGSSAYKLILNGSFVKEIRLVEKPFDLRSLADRMERVFPGLVRLREDIGAIVVMEKIKVTAQGVAEGGGLAADRVKAIYDEFVRESKQQ